MYSDEIRTKFAKSYPRYVSKYIELYQSLIVDSLFFPVNLKQLTQFSNKPIHS